MSQTMFSPPVAKAIAFVVAAAVFIGLMTLAAVGAGFLSDWFGQASKGWPAWGHIAFIAIGIAGLYSVGLYFLRRDQNADRANR